MNILKIKPLFPVLDRDIKLPTSFRIFDQDNEIYIHKDNNTKFNYNWLLRVADKYEPGVVFYAYLVTSQDTETFVFSNEGMWDLHDIWCLSLGIKGV